MSNKHEIVSHNGRINILKLALVVVKRWVFVVVFMLLAIIGAIIYSGVMNELYKSHVEIEFRSSDVGGFSNMILGQYSYLGNLTDTILPKDITIADIIAHVARTPRIIDKIIEKNNLMKVYGAQTLEPTRNRFKSKVDIKVNDLGLLEITFKDEDKIMAYNIILSYIEEIEEYFRWKSRTLKQFSLLESETSINQLKNELFDAKIQLKDFQKEYGIFDVELYADKLAEHIAGLRIQLIQAKIDCKIKNQEYKKLGKITEKELSVYRESIKIIENELYKLKNITESSNIAYNDLPDINIEYMEVYTNVKSLTLIYDQLRLLYNAAKINIDKDVDAFIVVNEPEIAEQKFFPNRSKIVIIITLLASVISLFICFIMEYFERAYTSKEDKKILLQMKNHLFFLNRFTKKMKSKIRKGNINE
ncbi:MAG: hypothetical protein KAT05_05740 [Spirochaetes bacterium]|nr:hypothetical protein [Spirochaetota bacterium]